MEFRRPTPDELRLLRELARVARLGSPEAWLDALQVRGMDDGGMGSLEFMSMNRQRGRSRGVVVCAAAVQFTDEDGVEVIASLNASENGVPFELDIWKTDFSPLIRIPDVFRSVTE